jgi:hypothetical protein
MGNKFKDSDFKEVVASPFLKMDDKKPEFILNEEKIGNTVFAKLLARETRKNELVTNAVKHQEIYTFEMEDGTEFRFAKGNIEDKGSIYGAMKKIVIGQWVKLVFDSIVPAKQKGYRDFKLVKVYEGPIDPEDDVAGLAEAMGGEEVPPFGN